ncbi:MAG TPA: HD domain-containing phosphohydrolase [Ktedonobacteraceae bacterium]|jgi:putative nucleotidyltransferase with HDIG domain|nr:HD domain-containing phosphohydrolase [Ktedonosporobacter sp.]HZU69187.1 HD domain-containing phosphohydrolase [Ktedonobacteraceae bacterium]
MIVTRGILPGITLLDAVEAVVSAIDARNCSFGHSIRVASYAVQIAEAAGWQQQMLEQIQLGALLHDIGQIYWPDTIIEKQGVSLTEEEREIIESHTLKGVELIKGWPSLSFVEPYILYHQEWIDGSGYPFGLKGDALPDEVQVVSLADVYEALSHPRKYKERLGFSSDKAVEIMTEMKGRRWKCELFDVFVHVARDW